MFTKLKLKNYKSLINIELDLTKQNVPKNLIIIYGENGIGKSNLTSVFLTLMDTLTTMSIKKYIQDIMTDADSLSKISESDKEGFLEFLSQRYKDIKTIIDECKTINSENNMSLEFHFIVNNTLGHYLIEMDNENIVKEELYYKIDKNRGYQFKLNKDTEPMLNKKIFFDSNYFIDIKNKIDKFWGKNSLLSIIYEELENSNESYFEDKLSHNLLNIIKFFTNITCETNIGRNTRIALGTRHMFFSRLEQGEVSKNEKSELIATESFLNEVFTSLYSDIKKVYYKIEDQNETIKYKLYFKKQICNTLYDIVYSRESTGTLKILSLIPQLYEAVHGRIVIIDEIDSQIHDILLKNIILSVNKYIRGQLIITTHNTLLMESNISNDSLYFLRVNNKTYTKEILCLSNYQKRTHPNNNIRSLYLKGLYGGIPVNESYIDFDELEEILDNE